MNHAYWNILENIGEKSRKEEAIILLCKTSQSSFQPQSHSDF